MAALARAWTRPAVSSRPLGKAAFAVHSPLGVHACLRRSLALDRLLLISAPASRHFCALRRHDVLNLLAVVAGDR